MKKNNFFILLLSKFLAYALLITSVDTQAMDKLKDNKPKKTKPSKTQRLHNWVVSAGNIILGKTPVQSLEKGDSLALEKTSFAQLPAEIQFNIIDALRTTSEKNSLNQVAKALRRLALINKELHNLINNPQFCLNVIKHYARIFETNDAIICAQLSIPATKTRLAIQDALINDICTNDNPDTLRFKELMGLGFDPYFTDSLGDTPAEICIRNYNLRGLEMLLSIGVDPEFVGKNGMRLYDLASSRPNRKFAREMAEVLDRAIDEKHTAQK